MVENVQSYLDKALWLRRPLDRKPYLVIVKTVNALGRYLKNKSPFVEDDCELRFDKNFKVSVLFTSGDIIDVSNEFLFRTRDEASAVAPIRPGGRDKVAVK